MFSDRTIGFTPFSMIFSLPPGSPQRCQRGGLGGRSQAEEADDGLGKSRRGDASEGLCSWSARGFSAASGSHFEHV